MFETLLFIGFMAWALGAIFVGFTWGIINMLAKLGELSDENHPAYGCTGQYGCERCRCPRLDGRACD